MILSDAARELRNKKAREYYKTHKRQYAEANRRYWEKKAAEEQAKAQADAHTPDAAKNKQEAKSNDE